MTGRTEEDDDAPPPGFEKKAASSAEDATPEAGTQGTSTAAGVAAEAEDLAASLASATKLDGGVDEPDLALRLNEGLQEREEAAITTQTQEGGIYASATSFEILPISQELLKGLYVEMKFERPSRIQATTLPMILTPPYRDLIAQAHNGSGKTTCFVLAMLSRVDPAKQEPQAICMCPTRELVVQNLSVLQRMGKFSGITATSTAKDTEMGGKFRSEKVKEQVVIGTHGKLKAWANKRLLLLGGVVILVFDEADQMLKEDAFADDSTRLIQSIRKANPKVQLLLFSATFNDQVKGFAMRIAPKANHVFVAKEELSLDVIAQFIVPCPDTAAKTRVLKEMIFPNCEKLGQTIIFVKTRESAKMLHREMDRDGYKCSSIQGDMQHSERDKVVQEFRNGVTKVLISTDVLSRGFDVSQVTLVINYDLPVSRDGRTPEFEVYLHRIGRSGRFGRKGIAFNLVCGAEDVRVMDSIQNYFNKHIESIPWNDEDKFMEVLAKNL